MKHYDRIILNALLDSYENSTAFKENHELQRNLYFRLTPKNFPEYFDERSSVYDEVHQCAEQLRQQELVFLHWKGKKENHILEKISLNLDRVEAAYPYVGRTPLRKRQREFQRFAEECTYEHSVIQNLLSWICQRMEEGKGVKKYVDLEHLKEFQRILLGVHGILENEEECFVRELSMVLYGDSKQLEEYRSRIETIITDFSQDNAAFENTEDIFQEFNVLRNPSLVMIKGGGRIVTGGGGVPIDLTDFSQGLGFSGVDIASLEFEADMELEEIITIENLTAFHRCRRKNSLIVYLAGFHNRNRRSLIQKAQRAYPHAKLLHWGDVDIGGFKIYLDLCRKTGLPFRTVHMDKETLETYAPYAKPLTDNDKKALKGLREQVLQAAALSAEANVGAESDINVETDASAEANENELLSVVGRVELLKIADTLDFMELTGRKLEQEIVAFFDR